MNAGRVLLVAGLALLPAVRSRAEAPGFERYQVIIDRAPFGGLPGSAAAPPQPGFGEGFSFFGIVEEQGKLRAVIQPRGAPKPEYKAEGETIGEVVVVKIEAAGEASKVTIQQGIEKATLAYLPRGAAPPAAAPAPAAPQVGAPPQPTAPAGLPPRRRIPMRRGD